MELAWCLVGPFDGLRGVRVMLLITGGRFVDLCWGGLIEVDHGGGAVTEMLDQNLLRVHGVVDSRLQGATKLSSTTSYRHLQSPAKDLRVTVTGGVRL